MDTTRVGYRAVAAGLLLAFGGLGSGAAASAGASHTAARPATLGAEAVSRWLPPLPGKLTISQPYRAPPTPYAAGHRGIDLPAPAGARVTSPTTGLVEFVGVVVDREVITVRVSPDTVFSLEPVATGVAVGDAVSRGAQLGFVGSGGHCGSECIHLGVRRDGEYVSPMRYFLDRPELLPW